jgi:hypothetical protein
MLASVYLVWFITIGAGVYGLYHVLRLDRGLLDRAMIPYYAAFIVGSLLVLLPFHPHNTRSSGNGVFRHICKNMFIGLLTQC